MKKQLKSIARSMNTSAKCQLRNNAMYADALTYSWENLQINRENANYHRDVNRIMMKKFELEHAPFVSVLEGLLELIPADLGKQEVVGEARRMIGLMKSVQEKL